MLAHQLEAVLGHAEKTALVAVLRSHPEWTLAELSKYFEQPGPRAAAVGAVTIAELVGLEVATIEPAQDEGLHAEELRGENFDALLELVIAEAGCPVGAAYLRANVGGPRWKLQAALRRLVDAGAIVRTGVTSSTRYHARRQDDQG